LKKKVAILGATGMIGQSYLRLLENHPWFEISSLTGGKSAGKKYGDAANWLVSTDIPVKYKKMTVSETKPSNIDADIVFSALPAEVAQQVDNKFANAGYNVISDSSAFRRYEDVPVIIPEVNAEHIDIIKQQKRKRKWDGLIVSNPNCSTIGLALVLKPLYDSLRIKRIVANTMQALSGAGYPGVPSIKIVDNVIPYIEGEEEKVLFETLKILGNKVKGKIVPAQIEMGISCNRVATIDGHLQSIYVETKEKVNLDRLADLLSSFKGKPQELRLPFAPKRPIIVREENDRPQPRLDRFAGSVPGMSATVGRIRKGSDSHSFWMHALSHNTVRGGAGSSILMGEFLVAEKFL
jgi:aspartate-semialdehyde dehydrogenase